MLLKNESASLKLEFVNYEFPEAGAGADEYDRNWLESGTAMKAISSSQTFSCPPGRRGRESGFPHPFTCPTPWTATTPQRWTAP